MNFHLFGWKQFCVGFLLGGLLIGCVNSVGEPSLAQTTTTPTVVSPKKLANLASIENSLITPLIEGLDNVQMVAQAIALNAAVVQNAAQTADGSNILRTEVFNIYPARESDFTAESAACLDTTCYRVDIYNFGTNWTSVALVDVENGVLIDLFSQGNSTPEMPAYLTARAIEIATTSLEVIAELGFNPVLDDPTMPNVKTALNNTKCERSQHLCVAPTFIVGTRALWVIVDLVAERVVATRWTELGDFSSGLPTEELIARDAVYEEYCEKEHQETRGGWSFNYMITSTDGLRLSEVAFAGVARFRSIKLVDYHVSYSEREGFGYSDAVGCPKFSSAAVVALDAPIFEDIIVNGEVVGFALNQDYVHPQWPQPCNYRYRQRYEFYDDGRLRVMAANLGRGCGNDATYRFLYRIDPVDEVTFASWEGGEWQNWEQEQWQLDEGQAVSEDGFLYKYAGIYGGYGIEPNRGQFGDGSRGDNAFVYVTQHKSAEGDADMVTLGVCCNINYEQGPEEYIDNEVIEETDIVIWVVPQIENDDTPGQEYCWADQVIEEGMFVSRAWACWAGPMLVPIEK